MRLPITPANTLWRALRDEIRGRRPAGRVIVGVDGADAASVADALAAVFDEQDTPVFRASASGFLLPRAQRAPHGDYDWSLLRRVLVDPFHDGRHTSATTGFQLAGYDPARDAMLESRWVTTDADAVLILDGPDLHVPSLADVWDYTVNVGGTAPADAVVDRTDPQHPLRVSADS